MPIVPVIDSIVFLDASYAIAAASPKDKWHQRALEIGSIAIERQIRVVTTNAVLAEIGDSLSKVRLRPVAVALLHELRHDPLVEIIPLDIELYDRSVRLYENRMDKEWGVRDCVSFIIMQERGIRPATGVGCDIEYDRR